MSKCASLLFVFVPIALCADGAEVRGQVVDATNGQPLVKVLVSNYRGEGRAETDAQGRFTIEVPESAELLFSSVGYRPYRLGVRASDAKEFEIRLIPDTLRTAQSVDVSAGPYALEPSSAGNALSLAGAELRNLASVLSDDPLRAIQGLPGVNPNDDFQSQLSLRGAGFNRIGIYVDGILLHSPYHTVQSDPTSASLTVLSSDLIGSAVLYPSAPPPNFPDRTVAAVDLRLRDGDRKKFSGRGSASASNAAMSLEGPLGSKQRASWLISARKSYLQYIINATTDEPSLAFGFSDVQGRVSYDLTPRHTVRMSLIHGVSGLDRAGAERQLGLNSLFDTDYDFTVASASSRWMPASTLSLNNTFGWMRESYLNRNRDLNPLSGGHYGEWLYNNDNLWQWNEHGSLSFGGTVRRPRDNGYFDRRVAAPPFAINVDNWRGSGLRSGVHVFHQYGFWRGRLQVRAGGRLDHHDASGIRSLSPVAAVAMNFSARTTLHVNWGLNVQYPEIAQIYSRLGRVTLLPERSNAVNVALEHRLDDRTRVRMEAYQRLDRDLIWRPLQEARILNGHIYGGNLTAPYDNSLRGYARGLQMFLQRRTSNGLTGWVSYAYGRSRLRDGVAQGSFPADFDQKHTLNVFGSYRLRPTVNVSARWVYGSGFPVRGYFRGPDINQTFLSAKRNELRLPVYHRMDLRANKTFVRKGWHATLFTEVINLYNRDNARFDDLRSLEGRTGAVRLGFDRLFPIIPSAGISVDF